MKNSLEEKKIHEFSGFNISVVSAYEETQLFSHRGANEGEFFIEKIE